MFTLKRAWLATYVITSLVAAQSSNVALADPPRAPGTTVLLVHGAFADGSSWDEVVPLLQASGLHAVAVHEPLTSFAEDVAAVKRAIDLQNGPVVLVGHSYGGAVISEAGNDAKVTALVYVAAFAPDTGESISDLGRNQPLPPWFSELVVDAGGFGWLPAATIASDFAQDLSRARQRLLSAKQGPTALASFDATVSHAAWRDKPVFYVRAEQDRMIDPAAQAAMAQRMNAITTSLPTSHVAMLARPFEIARVIVRATQQR